jgi:regulation of enolase protein 1 (concanavalin A-like superfamily)
VSVTTPQAPLPAGWQRNDIGSVGQAGSSSDSAGTFTLRGAGADVWGTSDAFHYVSRTVTGDADIVARVATVSGADPWTKVGVMIRDSVAANSAHAFMLVSTGKGLAFQRRVATGGVSTTTAGGAGTAPRWVKLSRRGNVFTASVSTNGSTWSTVGSDTIAMTGEVYAGLAVTSHDTTQLATGTFDSIAVLTPLPAGWNATDIGAVGTSGSSSESGGTFTVKGAGADVWGKADGFHFAYRTLAGDGAIVARVATMSGSDPWTKVGVMIRESVDAGAAHAFMLVSTGRGLAFQRRTVAGGVTTSTSGGSGAAPRWVKLTRAGTAITASVSADGVTWTTVGSDTVSLSGSVLVGLAVTSHTTSQLATGTFESVAVAP